VARRPPAVARVLERVTATARRYEMFRPGDLVLACVSGGPDSVCLLYSLWHLRRLFKIKVEVFHFDHRLRAASGNDADYVRSLCERLHLPFHLRTADSKPSKGQSVEAWATVNRGNAANDVRKQIKADVVVEGHTLDDQAETVLLNVIRGTGLEGATGIWPTALGLPRHVEPLIDVERWEVEGFCRALHLRPRRDPTNVDTSLMRNALRLKGIPAIERATGREVKRSIARSADLLREDRTELYQQSVRARNEILVGEWSYRDMTFDASMLRELPRPIASRAVRSAVYQVMEREDVAPWSKAAVDAVLDLAKGRPGRSRDLADGLKAWRDRRYVHVARPSPDVDRKEGKR
jgi:tRNA(Ile)-lysidine synthase